MLSGKHLPYKSVISALLYIIATAIERPSLQMCQGLSHIVLSVNTGRVDGPLLATYCREREQLVNRICLVRVLVLPGTMQDSLFKRDYAWEIMLFAFYQTASNKHKCRKGKYMDSLNGQSCASKLYALQDNHLRI